MPENYRVERWAGGTDPDTPTLRRRMAGEGYRVYEWSDRPGAVYDVHEHDDDQSHWVVSGSLELTIENTDTFVLGPGDRDFMPAGTLHSARVVSSEPVVYLVGSKR